MKITAVRLRPVRGTLPVEGMFWEERLVRPIDVYPDYRARNDFEGLPQTEPGRYPIEAHFGPLRTFVVAGSNHPNHTVATKAMHAYLRWRNANARRPDVLAAQRRERARIRSERQRRWGQPTARAAA